MATRQYRNYRRYTEVASFLEYRFGVGVKGGVVGGGEGRREGVMGGAEGGREGVAGVPGRGAHSP